MAPMACGRRVSRRRTGSADRSLERAAIPPPTVPHRSVAVLPCRPLMTETRDEPLEIGLTEAVIVRLGRLNGLRVPSIDAERSAMLTWSAMLDRQVGTSGSRRSSNEPPSPEPTMCACLGPTSSVCRTRWPPAIRGRLHSVCAVGRFACKQVRAPTAGDAVH
jgi:hypothetical protein